MATTITGQSSVIKSLYKYYVISAMMLSLQITLICIQLLYDSVDSLKEVCRKGEDINKAYEKLFDTMNSSNLEDKTAWWISFFEQ